MKKTSFLFITAVITFLLTGCGEMNETKLLKKVEHATKNKTLSSLSTSVNSDLSINMQDVSANINLSLSMDAILDSKNNTAYFSVDTTFNVLDSATTGSQEIYIVPENDVLIQHVHNVNTDSWMKKPYAAELSNLSTKGFLTGFNTKNFILQEEIETLNGTEVYVLSYLMPGDDLQNFYSNEDETTIIECLLDTDAFASIDLSPVEFPITIYIDTQSYLPVQMSVDIENTNFSIGALFADSLDPTEDFEINFIAENLHIVCDSFSFESVEVPALPDYKEASSIDSSTNETTDIETSDETLAETFTEETDSSAEDTPKVSDTTKSNSYSISSGDTTLTVVPPANWIAESLTNDMISICDTEDYSTLINYFICSDTSSEAIYDYIESDIVSFYKQNNLYAEHGYSDEVSPVDCIWFKCTDDSMVYYAWMKLTDTDYVLMEIDCYSNENMNAIISQAISMIL